MPDAGVSFFKPHLLDGRHEAVPHRCADAIGLGSDHN
jgi:hypothetical protein